MSTKDNKSEIFSCFEKAIGFFLLEKPSYFFKRKAVTHILAFMLRQMCIR